MTGATRFRTLALGAALALGGWAQGRAFEAASIKPAPDTVSVISGGDAPLVPARMDGARVEYDYAPLRDLIAAAFGVRPNQVSGPGWLATTRFNIVAAMPAGAGPDQVPGMLQTLLRQRFELAAHRERQTAPGYLLEVGRNGPKLKAAPPGGEGVAAPVAPPGEDGTTTIRGGEAGPIMLSTASGGAQAVVQIRAPRMTMADLAAVLTRTLDRPVLDRTGLTGAWQVSLDLSPDAPAVAALGLRLEKHDEAQVRIVVDRIARTPAPN